MSLEIETKKEMIEKEYLKAVERLNLALSVGNLAWWELNLKTGLVSYNENKIKMLGYSSIEFPQNIHYMKFVEIIHPEDQEYAMNAMRDHISGKKELYEIEYRIRCKDGRYIWFYDRGAITERDDNHQPVMIKGVVFDNTERKEQELNLKKLNEMKERFISVLAHDLKNLINGIIGLSSLLNDHYGENSDSENLEFIRLIHSSSIQTNKILNDLLQWGRLQNNDSFFFPERFDLLSIVNSVIQELEFIGDQKKIKIKIASDNHAECYADKIMTEIVIRNLLTNAVKFSYENSSIYIRLKGEKNKTVIEIEDEGIGMNQKTMEKLFNHSVQSAIGTKGEKGTGFGLSLSAELVKINGGDLTVKSILGKGSIFYLTLPR